MLKEDTPTNASENVVPFRDAVMPPGHRKINEELVAILTDLLEDAMSGHISSIAYCAVSNTDMIKTNWAGSSGRAVLGYGLVKLQHEYFGQILAHNGD